MSTPIKLFVTTTGEAPTTNGKAVSGTDTYYSKMWGGFGADAYDLQVFWTGDPTGTFTLQVSNKPNPVESTDADWTTSTEITVVNPAGSASGFRVAKGDSPGKKRLKYVNASGSGTMTGYATVPRK